MSRNKRNFKHGMTKKVPEYDIWKNLRARCNNPNNPEYPNYGGRGITVHPRWDDFSSFMIDMGSRPSPKHQIDRIDNGKGYLPWNCRWVTLTENLRNRRNTTHLTLDGVTKTLVEWAQEIGISHKTLRSRIYSCGWSDERALTTPVRPHGRKA